MARCVTGYLTILLLILNAGPSVAWGDEGRFRSLRESMVAEIESDVRATSERIEKRSLGAHVLEAMRRVARHEFVPESEKAHAYENRPLPIGYGQTISQPYIVAVMTDLLDLHKDGSVLEVGTGSGYQAAILAECVKEVYTVEIIPELGQQAKKRLSRLNYSNVEVRLGDGYYGWKEHAPFDGIIVTAASSSIPPPLIDQLKPKGKMVIPVGGPFMVQQLMLVEKSEDGKIRSRQLLPVMFVPLTGNH
jgi:protein-L-isoaspartate(D-aspartate) O-methyltransferase